MNNAVSFLNRKRVVPYALILLAAALLLATVRRAPDQTHENVIHNATQLSSGSSGDFSYQNAGTSIIVTGYAGDSDKIVIPSGSVIEVRLVQFSKAYLPISVTGKPSISAGTTSVDA